MPDKTVKPSYRLGIDLGGTKMCAVVIDPAGKICGRSKRSTKPEQGYRRVLARIARTGQEALAEAGIQVSAIPFIGLGVPGPVDQARGRLLMSRNLKWDSKPIAQDLGLLMKRPVLIDNDVNCGALGEITCGAARKARTAVLAFVGTGLGGALALDGRILSGAHGFGGEIGHMATPFSTALCSCGQTGCLETLVSKQGIMRLIIAAEKSGFKRRLVIPKDSHPKASDLVEALKNGCQATRRALKQSCDALAWGLAVTGTVFDPEVFVLGGGVMEALGDKLLPLVAKRMPAWSVLYRQHAPVLRLASLGDDAVALGATLLSVPVSAK